MPKYLTTKEVALILRITEKTVWQYVKDKKIKAIQPSRRYWIREEDLLSFIKKYDDDNRKAISDRQSQR